MGKFPKAFWQMAVDRLNHCENIMELAKELSISRRLLSGCREKLEPTVVGNRQRIRERQRSRKRSSQLKQVLDRKVLAVDFSKVPRNKSSWNMSSQSGTRRLGWCIIPIVA